MRGLAAGTCRPYRVRATVLCIGVIGAIGFPDVAVADDDALTQFGRLPVSFNGRITTIESAAAAMLRQASGRDIYVDGDGRRHSAAEWYLSEAGRGDDTPRPKVLRIENAELLALAKLEPRSKPGPNQHRYSLDELLPSIPALREAKAKVEQAAPSEFTTALDALSRAYHTLGSVRLSFSEPDVSDLEQVKQAIAGLEQLDSLVMPLLVPPHEGTNRWIPWARAVVDNLIAQVVPDGERKPHPAVPLLAEIFEAWRKNDDERFAKSVAAYAAHLKARPPRAAALDFQVPEGWHEMGTYAGNQAAYFDDTLAEGTTASLLSAHGDTDSFRVNIYYFPGATAPVEHVANDWRIGSGYAPLGDHALQKTFTRGRIGSADAVSIDLAYTVTGKARRLRASIVRRKDDGFVVMSVGSREAMTTEESRYASFLESLKFGSPDDARAWFHLRSAPPRDLSGSSMLVAAAKHGSEIRRFRVAAPGSLSEAERTECLKFIVRFKADEFAHAGNRYGRKLPAGWEAVDVGEGPGEEYWFGKGQEVRVVSVRPLADYGEDSELALFNHSRTQFGLPPCNSEELDKHVRTMKFAGGEARYVELIVEKTP